MSENEFPSSRGRATQYKKEHSFDMDCAAGSIVDREINRLFGEFWESTERSKILRSRREHRKVQADAFTAGNDSESPGTEVR
jgi:hypothetical protein